MWRGAGGLLKNIIKMLPASLFNRQYDEEVEDVDEDAYFCAGAVIVDETY